MKHLSFNQIYKLDLILFNCTIRTLCSIKKYNYVKLIKIVKKERIYVIISLLETPTPLNNVSHGSSFYLYELYSDERS